MRRIQPTHFTQARDVAIVLPLRLKTDRIHGHTAKVRAATDTTDLCDRSRVRDEINEPTESDQHPT
jgi:hypothetical protein